MNLPPAIFIIGPTASGKTGLAMKLMKHFPIELISVDSALVYKGMDIGHMYNYTYIHPYAQRHTPSNTYTNSSPTCTHHHLLTISTLSGLKL